MLQKLSTVRREAAAREAEITDQAAVHRAEAEAAAQLVAAMRPKGDNVLATLWTEVTSKCLFNASIHEPGHLAMSNNVSIAVIEQMRDLHCSCV